MMMHMGDDDADWSWGEMVIGAVVAISISLASGLLFPFGRVALANFYRASPAAMVYSYWLAEDEPVAQPVEPPPMLRSSEVIDNQTDTDLVIDLDRTHVPTISSSTSTELQINENVIIKGNLRVRGKVIEEFGREMPHP